MTKDEEENVSEAREDSSEELASTDSDKEDEEEDVQGHISVADTWLPGTNKWKRRR